MNVAPVHPAVSRRRPMIVLCLALAMLAATITLWARSRSGHVDLAAVFLHGGRASGVAATRGQLLFVLSNLRLDARRAWTIQTASIADPDFAQIKAALTEPPASLRHFAGFAVAWRNDWPSHVGGWHLAVGLPYWFVAGLCAMPALFRLRRILIRAHRRRSNLCLHCGYDLRASAGRCPECGAATADAEPSPPRADAVAAATR